MANTIRDYSATAASNTTVDGADISEGCSPAGINDAIRGVMADLKDVSTGAVSLESPAADSLSLSGALTTTSTIDGRDVAADGTKLDGIEASADVTDAGNVNPLVDAHLNQSTAASGEVLSWNGSDYDWIAAGGGGDLLAANNLSDLDNAATARTNLGLGSAATTASTDYATAAQGATADAALANVADDTTPQLGGSLDVNNQDIVSTSNGDIDLDPNGSGKVVFKGNATKGSGQFVLNCEQNSHGIVIKGPPHSAAASYTLTLPNTDGSANEFLKTDGSGNLSWGAGATSYSDSDVDTHLNTSTASASEVLSWTGTDYDWVAQSSGGGGADLYAANEVSVAAQPSATGNDAIAIGDSAISSGEDAFAGPFSRAAGDDSVALGIANNSSSYGAGGVQSISIGQQSRAMALQSVALGAGAYVDTDSARGIALGNGAYVQQCDYGTAIGAASRVHGGNTATEAIAMGSSYASGTNSFAVHIGNNTSSYGATAANSIAMGYQSKSTASGAVSIGDRNTASGEDAVVLGENNTGSGAWSFTAGRNNTNSGSRGVALGNDHTVSSFYTFASGSQNTASESYAHALGSKSLADRQGKLAHASLGFGTAGDSQYGRMVLSKATTDATPTILTALQGNSPASNNMPVIPTGGAQAFSGLLVAKQTGSANAAAWEIKGLIVNNGGTTTLVNSAITVIDNTPSWGGPAITADNTNNWLAITCTGAAATSIRWSCTLNTSELIFS